MAIVGCAVDEEVKNLATVVMNLQVSQTIVMFIKFELFSYITQNANVLSIKVCLANVKKKPEEQIYNFIMYY